MSTDDFEETSLEIDLEVVEDPLLRQRSLESIELGCSRMAKVLSSARKRFPD